MLFLNDAKKFEKEGDEETDGDNCGDDEFLSFTQLHDIFIILSIVIENIQLLGFVNVKMFIFPEHMRNRIRVS